MAELIVWGCGGHAKVVCDTAELLGYKRIRFVDDACRLEPFFLGRPVTNPDALDGFSSEVEFIVAIGANVARARCFAAGLGRGWKPATLIHPSAVVSAHSQVAGGSVVFARAVVNAGATIGRNCIVNSGAVVEHDCSISDHVHLSPGSTLGGGVSVKSFALVGLNASLLPGLNVGSKAIVGAGAVVVRDVPDETTVVGSPARIVFRGAADVPGVAKPPISTGRILLSAPHMSGLEKEYVDEAFASNWLSTVGPNISAFEKEFGEKFGVAALAVGSGTAAIHLGLRALGVGPGDLVFCSDFTFVASANPILYLGATPLFIDSEEATWNMDPVLLENALAEANRLNRLPKAVVVVHLFGQCADMDRILSCCASYGVPVLEDAAEAIGATCRGRPAGVMGRLGTFSFNGNKMITTAGGGMLVSGDPEIVGRARFWATQAREAGLVYEHREMGYNYRLSNVLAGIGRGQLRVLEQRVERRREIALIYQRALMTVPGISPMPEAPYGRHARWLSCFLIDDGLFGCSRDELIARLDKDGIETRPLWKPMHLQPLYRSARCYGGAVAERLFERGLCLPSSSSLSSEDQRHVIDRIALHGRVQPLISSAVEADFKTMTGTQFEKAISVRR